MKEHEVEGLIELKAEYENRLSQCKDYQMLREEFNKSVLTLVRDAIKAKGTKVLERPLTPVSSQLRVAGCGFCEVCITACTDCVVYS